MLQKIKYNYIFCTAMIGDYDFLSNHKWSKKYNNLKFICFTDQKKNFYGWELEPLPKEIIKKNIFYQHKYLKLFFDKYLDKYVYGESIFVWVDSNIYIKETILKLLYDFEISNDDVHFIKHPYRNSIYEEYLYLINIKFKNNLKIQNILKKQIEFYTSTKFDIKNNLLIEANFFIKRDHNKSLKTLMENWWNEIIKFPARDQLSLVYCLKNSDLNFKLLDIGKREDNIYFNHYGHKTKNLNNIHCYLYSKRHIFIIRFILMFYNPFHIFLNILRTKITYKMKKTS